jgi:hypothetical protein
VQKATLEWMIWIVLAVVPFAIYRAMWTYRDLIGCPERGDCYVPGFEYAYLLTAIAIGSALVLWPIALYRFARLLRHTWKRKREI